MKIENKRGQVWSLDLMVAMIIFLTGIIILYVYAINFTNQSNEQLNDYFRQGNVASELILNEKDIGILSNNRINQTKLDSFYAMDYLDLKKELGVINDFYFLVEELEISGNPEEYVGNANATPVNNLVEINRFTIYKNKPTKFKLYIWEL